MELRTVPHLVSPDESVSQSTLGAVWGAAGHKNEHDGATVLRSESPRRGRQWTIMPLSPGYAMLWEYKIACQIFSAKIFILIIRQILTPASEECLDTLGKSEFTCRRLNTCIRNANMQEKLFQLHVASRYGPTSPRHWSKMVCYGFWRKRWKVVKITCLLDDRHRNCVHFPFGVSGNRVSDLPCINMSR